MPRARQLERARGIPRTAVACIALVTCVGLALAACSNASSPQSGATQTVPVSGGTITSPDGHVKVQIPAGALARPTQISITPVARHSWPGTFTSLGSVGQIYALEPSGLHFPVPVTVTISSPKAQPVPTGGSNTGTGLAVVASVEGSGSTNAELLSDQKEAVDTATGATSSMATTTHFSDIAQVTVATYAMSPGSISTSPGPQWSADVTVKNVSPPAANVWINAHVDTVTSSGPVSVITPADELNNGFPSALSFWGKSGDSHTGPAGSWFCPRPGSGTFGADLHVTVAQLPAGSKPDFATSDTAKNVAVSVTGTATCAEKPGTQPSTPTTSTQRPAAIQAWFEQGTFSTHYVEPVFVPSWDYRWSIAIPKDPSCADGFRPGNPSPDEATWIHADESQGGSCNHSGQTYDDVTGHPGAITLVVEPLDHSWQCTMTFAGSAPQNQDPNHMATGTPPQCTNS